MAKGGGGASTILNAVRLIFTFWGLISITLIIVIISSISAIKEGANQKSFEPVIRRIGGELLNHDTKLYIGSIEIQKAGGLLVETEDGITLSSRLKYVWAVLVSFLRIFKNAWYVYFWLFMFYWVSILIITKDKSNIPGNLIGAFILFAIFSMSMGFLLVDDTFKDNPDIAELTPFQKLNPFKGVIKFAQTIPLIFNPIYISITSIDGVNVDEANIIDMSSAVEDNTNIIPLGA